LAALKRIRADLAEYAEPGDVPRTESGPPGVAPGQYALNCHPDARPGDLGPDFGAVRVLIGPEYAQRLHGTILDYVGPGFKFTRPAKGGEAPVLRPPIPFTPLVSCLPLPTPGKPT
jgi:Fe-S cluster assembly iron-binding protein IscA